MDYFIALLILKIILIKIIIRPLNLIKILKTQLVIP